MTCSPKTEPATMRVQSPQSGRRRRTLDEEKTQPRADRPHATPGGRKARLWCLGPGGREGDWRKRSELPPMEKTLQWDKPKRDQAPQGARKGERPPEED